MLVDDRQTQESEETVTLLNNILNMIIINC